MSNDNSSSKWLVGCLVAGAVAVLLCGGVVALIVFWGYQVAQQVGPQIQQQMQGVQFAAQWTPPGPDADADELLPVAVGPWSRVAHDDLAAIPELAIARDGLHGTYEGVNTKIEVYAYQVPMQDQAQLFQDALDAMESAGYTTRAQANVDMGSHHWMTFSFSPPERSGRMWWSQGWLFVMTSDVSGTDLEGFEQVYLRTIENPTNGGMNPATPEVLPLEQAAAAAEAETDETAPDDPDATETAPDDPEAAPDEPSAGEAATESAP